jgi:hypothetical protein
MVTVTGTHAFMIDDQYEKIGLIKEFLAGNSKALTPIR